ncbi:hypothetical protein BDQ17DRAFT_1360104 [Cyathus striatus]|nr:hypothetical protein BDQ17DRAFT_1360104 [Cyathus striatus]
MISSFNEALFCSLPPELWAEIFLQCLPASLVEPILRLDEFTTTPLSLSHVCRAWRAVTLSTPQLWATLPGVLIGEARGSSSHMLLEAVHMHLERSHNVPLRLRMSSSIHYQGERHPFLEALLPLSNRWGTLILDCNQSFLDSLPIRGQLSSLRNLFLNVLVPAQSTTPTECDVFKIAPLLRNVVVTTRDLQSITLPWDQLRAYDATSSKISASSLIYILQLCQELEELCIRNYSSPLQVDKAIAAVSPHVFPRLHALELHECSELGLSGSLADLLDNVKFPALEELSIVIRQARHDPFTPRLPSLIERSQCSLKKVVLHAGIPAYGDIAEIIRRSPALQHLDIKHITRNHMLKIEAAGKSDLGQIPQLRLPTRGLKIECFP